MPTDSKRLRAFARALLGLWIATTAFAAARADVPIIEGLPADVELEADSSSLVEPTRVLGEPPPAFRWERILRPPIASDTPEVRIPVAESTSAILTRPRWLERDTGLYRLTAANSSGAATSEVRVVVRPPRTPRIVAQPLELNVLSGAPVETPLILDGRPPLTTAWWLDGVRLTNQFLAAPVLPSRSGFTGGTLVGVVSNRFGSVTSAPIRISVVGTNLHREDFNGRTAPGWTPAFTQVFAGENRFGRSGFRNQTGSFRLTNAVPAGPVVFGFDVWANDTWDGDDAYYGPDRWTASVAGAPVYAAAFSNNGELERPAYYLQRAPFGPGLPQTAPRLGSLGMTPVDPGWNASPSWFGRLEVDTPYRLRFLHGQSDPVFAADFQGEGLSDESWSLDNVYLARPPAGLAWIRFGVPGVLADEAAGTVSIPVERLGNTNLAVELRLATQDASAVAGVDYQPLSGKVRFEPGETRKEIVVALVDNPTADPARSFGIWLLDTGANAVFVSQPFAAVGIRDDESSVRLVVETTRIPSGATTRVARVERTGDLSGQVSFEVRLEPGSARLGEDFRPYGATTNVGWMYFEVGSTRAFPRFNYVAATPEDPLVVQATADAAWEGPEGFRLSLDLGGVLPVAGDAAVDVVIFPAVARLRISAGTGRSRLHVEVPDGRTGLLERSTDLGSWTAVETVSGSLERDVEGGASVFYRVRSP